jgi:hypothetical protein
MPQALFQASAFGTTIGKRSGNAHGAHSIDPICILHDTDLQRQILAKLGMLPVRNIGNPLQNEGNILFRSLCLWVLMSLDSRAMILPGKSGISVPGTVRGLELANPSSLMPKPLLNVQRRTVRYSHLDVNGHMNNTHYLDWVEDLLPSQFHENCPAHDFTICYHAEATEGQNLDLHWELLENGVLQVDAYKENGDNPGRAFSVQVLY